MPTTAGNRTSVGISNRCRDSGYGSALERLKAALGSTGYLWLANYDGTSRMNPNWLKDTDDFGAGWTKSTGVTVAAGQADPEGNSNAVKITDDGSSAPLKIDQTFTTASPVERWYLRIAVKAGGSSASDKKASIGIYNNTAASFPAQTMSIVSGSGTVVSGAPDDITSLSETGWTTLEVSLDGAAVAGNTYRLFIYPGTDSVAAASVLYAFRPTVEAAGHDGLLWSTGATAPQPPAKWDDMIQGLSAAPTSAPYLRWNSVTNAFEMAFDGTDDLFATAPVSEAAQPNTMFALAQWTGVAATDRLFDGISGTKSHLIQAAANWQMYSGTLLDSGDASDSNLHMHRALYSGASSQQWLDGVSISSGDAGAHGLTGFTVGSSWSGGNYWKGGVSAVAFAPSSLTAAQSAYVESLINQLHNQAVTLP